MENVIAYSVGIVAMSVCVKNGIKPKLIEEEANRLHPTGIRSKWKLSKEKHFKGGETNPCKCDEHPTKRKHYLLTC